VDGNILVVDHGNDRIQIFDSTGIFLTLFGPNDPKHKLKAPVSLLLDPDGQIFVADEENNITVWG